MVFQVTFSMVNLKYCVQWYLFNFISYKESICAWHTIKVYNLQHFFIISYFYVIGCNNVVTLIIIVVFIIISKLFLVYVEFIILKFMLYDFLWFVIYLGIPCSFILFNLSFFNNISIPSLQVILCFIHHILISFPIPSNHFLGF